MMNKYNPDVHHRRSIRLKGYDYSQSGLYFVTICVKKRICLFGEIDNAKMILNDAGTMIKKWYYEIENKFLDIKCFEMIIMPNHFHCIIKNVGADLCVCPDKSLRDQRTLRDQRILGEHTGSPLHRVVQWFKTMTTNEYIRGVKNNNWQRFDGKLWQLNYWEQIIRNEKSYQTISEYVANNPDKWNEDKLNPSKNII